MRRVMRLVILLGGVMQAQAQLADLSNFLSGLEIEAAYARVTMIPLIQLNWAALLDLIGGEESEYPFFYPQDRAWASMGTYLPMLLLGDPNEMNLPALDIRVRYWVGGGDELRHLGTVSYVQIVTNPFLSPNQRLFFLHGKTGVDKVFGDDSPVWVSGGAYAHVTMLGAEDVGLIPKFYMNHFYGAPPKQALYYGLGYVLAGSGFHFSLYFGDREGWEIQNRFYVELSAYLPFEVSSELGWDTGVRIAVNRDLSVFVEARWIKTLWQASGLSIGVRYGFGSLAQALRALESSVQDSAPSTEETPGEGMVPSQEPPPPALDTSPKKGKK